MVLKMSFTTNETDTSAMGVVPPPPRCHATAVSARAQAQCARGAWALMLIQDAAGEEGRRLM